MTDTCDTHTQYMPPVLSVCAVFRPASLPIRFGGPDPPTDLSPFRLAALMTFTVNLTSIFTQREPWPVSGVVLPPELQDVRPAPFEFGEDIRQTERPTYYFAYRVVQNLVRGIRKKGDSLIR